MGILDGFLQGFANTLIQQQTHLKDQEYKKALIEQSKLQTKLLENKIKLAETEQQQQGQFFNMVFGQGQGQSPGLPGQTMAPQSLPQETPSPPPGGGLGGYTPGNIAIPPGNLSYRNNNPGNLRFVGQAGASQGEGGFAKFLSPDEGFNALLRQIEIDKGRNLSLSDFVHKYAPPSENDTASYIANLSRSLGVPPNTPITSIPTPNLAQKVAWLESSTKIGGIPQMVAQTQMQPSQQNPRAAVGQTLSPQQALGMDILTHKYGGIDPRFREMGEVARTVDRGDRVEAIDKQGRVIQTYPKAIKQELKEVWNPTTGRYEHQPIPLPYVGGGISSGGYVGGGGISPPGGFIAKPAPQEIPQDMPATAKEKLIGMNSFINQLEGLQQLGTNKNLFGTINEGKYRASRTWAGGLPGVNTILRPDEQMATFMQLNDTVHATRLFEMGGKQATAMELKTILNTLPTVKDSETFKVQIDKALELAKQLREEIKLGYRSPENQLLAPNQPRLDSFQNKGKLQWKFNQQTGRLEQVQ